MERRSTKTRTIKRKIAMLQHLSVKNMILVNRLELDFSNGLNVLTGETGTGKSILLDALGFALGNRAEVSLLQKGADCMTVCAVFSDALKNQNLCCLCKEYDIELENELIIKRTLTPEGKSKIFFNDQQISQKLLKELTSCLAEVHGQFDTHGLMNRKNHLAFLDSCGNYQSLLAETKQSFENYKNLHTQLQNAQNEWQKNREDEDLIRHFADELKKLAPKHGEEEILLKRRQEMMNSEKIAENFNSAYQTLTAKADICSALRQSLGFVEKNNRLTEDKYTDLYDILGEALDKASDAVAQIEEIAGSLEFNTEEQNQVEERLFALKAAARKHNVGIEDLPEVYEDFCSRLNSLQNDESQIIKLAKEEKVAENKYLTAAKVLSQNRKAAAEEFAKKIMAELKPLKMEKAEFKVVIEELPENLRNEKGIDDVYFCVAANPNSPLGPIDKVASGGELSRLMLALKVNLLGNNYADTVIFDEIDSGIGGATAEAVGERLARLGKTIQVLAVTHSPQVAAKSDTHFKVCKVFDKDGAKTAVTLLSRDEKAEEIARMISGETISKEARAAARVLIEG